MPESDIVHLIVDAMAMMCLRAFEADYELSRVGQAPFAPQVLPALLVYFYSHAIRSSRAIERLCGRDAGSRFIVGAVVVPDYTVFAWLRQRHVARMQGMFLAVLRLCHEAGLARLGLVALDANRGARRIDKQARMLTEAKATDVQEDGQFGAQRSRSPRACATPSQVDHPGRARPLRWRVAARRRLDNLRKLHRDSVCRMERARERAMKRMPKAA